MRAIALAVVDAGGARRFVGSLVSAQREQRIADHDGGGMEMNVRRIASTSVSPGKGCVRSGWRRSSSFPGLFRNG
jgi:hypothetical protein